MRGEFGEGKTVTGAPLSGDFVVSHDTTLADGNRIHNESTSKVYRDAQGRVRREVGVDLATPATGNVKRSMVVIIDPVAGKRYMLNPDNKTARRDANAWPQARRANGEPSTQGHGRPCRSRSGNQGATGNQGGERDCRRKVCA